MTTNASSDDEIIRKLRAIIASLDNDREDGDEPVEMRIALAAYHAGLKTGQDLDHEGREI